MRYLTHARRFSFLLCLLAALHTSCTNNPRSLGFGEGNSVWSRGRSNSMPDPSTMKKMAEKLELLWIVENRLSHRGRGFEDPYDRDTFKEQMKELINSGESAAEVQYCFLQEEVPMLTVAAHYSKDKRLVKYLLEKDAHLGLTNREIKRCLVIAAENTAPIPQKQAILERLIKALNNASEYFQDPIRIDELLLECDPSVLLVLIDALNEQGINTYTVDEKGNTVLHRICLGSETASNKSFERLKGVLENLLQSNKFKECINIANHEEHFPIDILNSRVENSYKGVFWWHEEKFVEEAKELLKLKTSFEE